MAGDTAGVKNKTFSCLLTAAVLFSTFIASSCSLDYNQGTNSEAAIPEFLFSNATFNRYEDNRLTMSLEALQLEQYKSDGATYGQDVSFKTWNKKNELDTVGTCGLLSANTKDKIYTLFNNIVLKSNTQNVEIYADNLKWDGNSEQLTTGVTDKVSIKRDDVYIEGRGFSASGVSRSFAFSQPVSGTIETGKSKNKKQEGEANK